MQEPTELMTPQSTPDETTRLFTRSAIASGAELAATYVFSEAALMVGKYLTLKLLGADHTTTLQALAEETQGPALGAAYYLNRVVGIRPIQAIRELVGRQ